MSTTEKQRFTLRGGQFDSLPTLVKRNILRQLNRIPPTSIRTGLDLQASFAWHNTPQKMFYWELVCTLVGSVNVEEVPLTFGDLKKGDIFALPDTSVVSYQVVFYTYPANLKAVNCCTFEVVNMDTDTEVILINKL